MPGFVDPSGRRPILLGTRKAGRGMADDGFALMLPVPPPGRRRVASQPVNRSDLVYAVAADMDLPMTRAAEAVNAVLSAIEQGLHRGQEVRLAGFGTFSVSARKATTGRNPRTGERIAVGATTSVRFRPGKALRDAVSG